MAGVVDHAVGREMSVWSCVDRVVVAVFPDVATSFMAVTTFLDVVWSECDVVPPVVENSSVSCNI